MIQALLQGGSGHLLAYALYAVVTVITILALRRFRAAWTYTPSNPEMQSPRGGLTLGGAARFFLSIRSLQLLLLGLAGYIAARTLLGAWTVWDGVIFIAVWGIWPLQEWAMHAYLLHMKPIRLFGRTIEPIFVQTHRAHHLNPRDPMSGVVPVYFSVLYLLGLPLLWHFGLPLPQALTGVAASLMVILFYEWVHFLIHTSYQPKGRWYGMLWRNHRLHHFKNENHWYGVTTTTADALLGTHPEKEQIENSETCRTLEGSDATDDLALPRENA